ncbi:hypothetical protein FB559_7559 [Actinoallomurus bryophytorum]|uniref:Uncharacterized protein n=1 Tax=Actinoallomurus bryophytorum TaxID=1490222 RepID=A0A543BZJ9_9ACTN|nr:hypothetical protein FB559_7559 [Actinoallomurus bryophytorum]
MEVASAIAASTDPPAGLFIGDRVRVLDRHPRALPEIDRTRAAVERDQRSGALPASSDAVAMFMVAAYKSYLIFWASLARDIGLTVDQLDARVLAVHDQVLDSMADGPDSSSATSESPSATRT